MPNTGNTADIAESAALLWQVVRSNEACLRHHECQETWRLLLSSLLQLQKLQSRLPLPTRATFNGDTHLQSQEALGPGEESNLDSSPQTLVNTQTAEDLIGQALDESLPRRRDLQATEGGDITPEEWADALRFRQDISKSSIEEAMNGI